MDNYYKKALSYARSCEGMDIAVEWLAEIIKEIEHDTIDLCVKTVEGFASGHHFAGDLTGEKSFRRCMEVLQAIKDR